MSDPIPAEGVQTPDEWSRRLGITVHGPDGWRRDRQPWDEPITEEEFRLRASWSTCEGLVWRESAPSEATPGPVSPITEDMVEAAARELYGGPKHRFKVDGDDLIEYTVTWDEVVEKVGQDERDAYLRQARRILSVALAGCALVELREPDGVVDHGDAWWQYPGGRAWFRVNGRFDGPTRDRFRSMAAAMLSAVDYNERKRAEIDPVGGEQHGE